MLLCAALCLLAAPARAVTNDLANALQRGLFEEEANQNLGAAIQNYQTVASQFDKDRKLAATAIFRLGECYRKQGNTNDAATQYEHILREFSDQPTLVTLSRQSLTAMGSAPPAPAAAVLSDAARQEQKRLLEEEIRLVQKQLDSQQKQVDVGALSPDGLVPTQRDLLKLKRQIAALDAGLPVSIAATETSNPAVSTEAEEVKRIQALIKDSPDLINAPDRNGETLLESAAAKGKLAVVKLLLDSGAAVDGLQQPGLTALHYAAANGHKAVVDLLLSKGAKPGVQTAAGLTPLHLAAMKGYEEVAKALLAAGGPVNAQTKGNGEISSEDLQYHIGSGATPLLLAAKEGYTGMVELLLAKGAEANVADDSGRTPLSYAVDKRYQSVVQLLLAAHANPNAGSFDLPLATAAYHGDTTELKLLLANGANPNTNTFVNWNVFTMGNRSVYSYHTAFTPLFLAVNQHEAAAAAELLQAKADPNVPAPDGQSLLFYALSDTPTLKALLEAGADPNRPDGQGVSPLLQAVFSTNQPAVELLLAHKADPNAARTQDGWSPLGSAAVLGAKPIAELLLKAGAEVNGKDKAGQTPLCLAVRYKQPELAALLLANQADPNAKDNEGRTPLHIAVRDGRPELAELLLANKADPNERDNAGATPLDLAKSQAPSAQGRPLGPGFPVPRPMFGIPPNPYQSQFNGPGASATTPQQEPKPDAMVDLLRQHGALDDLPKLDRIMVQRRSIGYSSTTFAKGARDWGQFTLLDLIGVEYEFLAGSPNEGGYVTFNSRLFANSHTHFPFPDLAHLRIRRPAPDGKSWLERTVDLRPVFEAGDCSKDVRLEWGDVVEIPEADHPLNEKWPGFSRTELANLKKCLTRQVEIVINGQATNITLAPQISNVRETKAATNAPASGESTFIGRLEALRATMEPEIVAHTPFWLKAVLLQSQLVLTSSDLRHVKVTRRDPASGQEREWVVDCSEASPAPDFWLRDGDKIEVPEKTDYSQRLQNVIQRAPPSSPGLAPRPSAPAEQASPTLVPRLNRIVPLAPAAGPVGKPPLFQALPDGPTFKALLEDGADPNVRTAAGTPLLVQAVRDKNQVAVELLLSHKADVNAADSDGWTPLDYATADGLKAIVELLLQAGATVNARNPSGETALHIAVRGGERELAQLLLAHKADPNVRNNAGQTPLALARSMGMSLGMGGAVPLEPGSESPQTERYLSIGRVLYSPKQHDSELLEAGYHRDRFVRTRKAECWEQRAEAEISGRACPAVWTGADMVVFGGEGMGTSFDDGARYCFAEDTWAALPQKGAPSSRTGQAMVWTGREVIVWGGFGGVAGNNTNRNDGARYNPATDTWKPVTTKNAPAARFDFPAVWTGREMLVWGGYTDNQSRYQGAHADAYLNTGGRYNPSSDTWKTITTQGAPSRRSFAAQVWTGKEMIVWGGGNASTVLNDGARYNPSRDSWCPISTDGAPCPRYSHVFVWTGKEMIVWGGSTREPSAPSDYFENGARYNPETDTWKPISTIGAPKGRVIATAVWTGTEMIVWGGVNDAQDNGSRFVGTGARYNPATDTWTEMTVTGAPSPRLTAGVWTGEGLLTFGGYNGTHLHDTWFYSPSRTLYGYVKQ